MGKKEKYKRYGYEDAYDTEKENDWANRLSLDDCIQIMNNQFNEIVKFKQQLAEKDKEIERLKNYREELEKLCQLLSEHDMSNLNIMEIEKQLRKEICEEIREWAEENKVYCNGNSYDASLVASATNSTLFALKEFLSEIEKGE